MGKSNRTAAPRATACPSQPSVEAIADVIALRQRQALTKRRRIARRFADQRAEFTRRFVARYQLPANPAALSATDMARIHLHPQFIDPVRCPMSQRLFTLETQAAA